MRGLDTDLIFPSPVQGKGAARPMDYNAFKALFLRMGQAGITAHGFRTSFRTWCSDKAEAPRELAEGALAHRIGSAVEPAYARSRMVERRRPLMEAWADYCVSEWGKNSAWKRNAKAAHPGAEMAFQINSLLRAPDWLNHFLSLGLMEMQEWRGMTG